MKLKDMYIRIKWIFNQAKPALHYLVIIVILAAFSAAIGTYRAIVSKHLVDAATTLQKSKLLYVLMVFGACIIIDLIIKSSASIITAKFSVDISNNIRRSLYTKIMKTEWIKLSKYHSGDVLTRITSDVDAVTNMISTTIPSMISLSVLLIGSFIALLFMEPILALILIIISPGSILLSRFFSSRLKKMYLKSQKLESEYRSFLNESIQNIVIVKSFCLEMKNVNRLKNIQRNIVKITLSKTKLSMMANVILSLGYWSGYFLIFSWGSLKLLRGTTTFGTLTAMTQLIGNIQGPVSGLASLLPSAMSALASTERIMELEGLNTDDNYSIKKDIKAVGIVYKSVYFNYKKNVTVLNNISLNINPSETIALIGPSGEGKTTFLYLLLALISPTKGHLYIKDGSDKIDISASTRKFISYVPQGNTLFSGSIADNLRLGNPYATDEELKSAAKAAYAWEFIKDSPEGFNTKLGERGTGLSEGQSQRIAIARALLHKAPILILDEATSALDSETEVKVLKTIKNLKPVPTCIIITHRNTALKICDRVFKLENNHIIEQSSLIFKDIEADVI
ncbi:ABC transporter ATP-binding protein [Clostridium scatologenes]|uniref:Putative ABC transporter n=1 Tax=Clostridium scatologenes TaxID=1548 RepID=A0A0E3JY25_CLOSL|nr:ABC transporter ATP-binding protein [Clostridium scatologenes]AKA67170.1 putative ABC transporter [Clostridium scatologenes]